MSSMNALVDFLREHKPTFIIGNIAVYKDEKILVLEVGEKLIVLQAHTERAFHILLSNPEKIARIVKEIFGKEETLLPGDVSLMILKRGRQ